LSFRIGPLFSRILLFTRLGLCIVFWGIQATHRDNTTRGGIMTNIMSFSGHFFTVADRVSFHRYVAAHLESMFPENANDQAFNDAFRHGWDQIDAFAQAMHSSLVVDPLLRPQQWRKQIATFQGYLVPARRLPPGDITWMANELENVVSDTASEAGSESQADTEVEAEAEGEADSESDPDSF
jgi:hypothetical protein